MALLTPMTTQQARDVGHAYGLDVVDVRGIARGSVNSNFSLQTRDGTRFFLRVFEEQTRATAVLEAALLEDLARLGVPTPRPRPLLDGSGHLSSHAGKPVSVFPFVPGDIVCQAGVTAAHLAAVGAALARLHLAGEAMGSRARDLTQPFRFGKDMLRVRLATIPASAPPEVVAAASEIRRSLDENPWSGTEITVVHGDLFRDNVLWNGTNLAALLDFESAAIGCPAFDVMVTILSWCFGDDLDLTLARALVEGYGAVRPLREPEKQGLLGAGVFACDRFATTRITDFELRPAGSVIFKDFRRFVRRKRALVAVGSDRLRAALGVDA